DGAPGAAALASLLLPGLVMEERPHERSKSRPRRSCASKENAPLLLPGSETPTVASPSLLA
ncbi:unnamed protein product, partial [Prorocentrum cordatum]